MHRDRKGSNPTQIYLLFSLNQPLTSAGNKYIGIPKNIIKTNPGVDFYFYVHTAHFIDYYLFVLVGRSRDRFPVVSLGVFSRGTPDRIMCPEVDSASESEYQGFLLGQRRPVRLADDLPPL